MYNQSYSQIQREHKRCIFRQAIKKALITLLIGIVIVLLFVLAAHADEKDNKWTAMDTTLEAAVLYSMYVDWKQTDYGSKHPDKYNEENQFLGRHPSPTKVAQYFIGMGISHAAVACLLPKPWRSVWQVVYLGMEITAINQNYKAGIRIPW